MNTAIITEQLTANMNCVKNQAFLNIYFKVEVSNNWVDRLYCIYHGKHLPQEFIAHCN